MIKVLRLGHRKGRDNRVSTHVGLVARQWGADVFCYCGDPDPELLESIRDVQGRWGGDMELRRAESFREEIQQFGGEVVHLTMYGISIDDRIEEIEEEGDIMVVIGSEKVPREVYRLADHNIAVGHQPHSEIAALAVFLEKLGGRREQFESARVEVEPTGDRKVVREKDGGDNKGPE